MRVPYCRLLCRPAGRLLLLGCMLRLLRPWHMHRLLLPFGPSWWFLAAASLHGSSDVHCACSARMEKQAVG